MPAPRETVEVASKFIWLSKREGVSGLNVSTYFLLQLATALAATFMNTFLIFIVKDPNYYNIKKEDAGSTLGNLTFTAELFIIPSHLLFGLLMDAVGRKFPTSIGLVLAGVSIALIPQQHAAVFPILYILR
jgi:MFS family permease